ncbi:DUF3861 domain-containing protein [Photobacterium atrarenae]|uniref:DUF3861 domain-containing protein n=1 Tax=Photobacterium atrarenae TaxID=865757 RepID=A0ABY5GPD2_9GAMM|nr:DUF3861 domain-containing protein [Photobacterium atrarenae]UTV30991.1 DUF3861 domain-containing protein [Photobacterium atrarenae]
MKSLFRKPKHYRVTIEETSSEESNSPASLTFELQDREDLFAIVDKLKSHSGLDEQAATQAGVGLRLLGTVMMKERKHPLFSEFIPHFKAFIQQLKSLIK